MARFVTVIIVFFITLKIRPRSYEINAYPPRLSGKKTDIPNFAVRKMLLA
jgi:hypothetical protein